MSTHVPSTTTTTNMPEGENQQILSNIERSMKGLTDISKLLRDKVGELNRFIQRQAVGTGDNNGTENAVGSDVEDAADPVEQRDLAAPVLDELQKANSHFLQCLFLLGTIFMGGMGGAAVPCGYKAISVAVSVPVVMLIFGGTFIWKMHVLSQADPRRVPLLSQLRAPFMVDMGTALVGALFFLAIFGISSVMKNCGVENLPGPPPQ